MWKAMMVKLNGCILIEGDDLLKKYNIWDKVSTDIKEEFDSEPTYNKNFSKNKTKSYGDEATHFHDKMLKARSNGTRLAVITTDSALKKDKNYYPQVLLKECKYIEKEKKVIRDITEDLEIFSSDSAEEELFS